MKVLNAALIAGMGSLLAGCSTPAPTAEMTAEQVLEKSAKVYLDCRTYRDSGVVATTYITGDKRRSDKRTFTTAFRRPDSFRFELKDNDGYSFIVWRNGLEVKTWWDLQPVIQQGKSFSDAIAEAIGISGGTAHTVSNLLLPQDVRGRNVLAMKGAMTLGDGDIGGKSFYRVQVADKQVLWIGKEDFLIHRIESAKDYKNFKTEVVADYEPVVNEEIPQTLLDFNLPASAAGKATIKVTMQSREKALKNLKIYELMEKGRNLSADQAAQLEKQLTGTEKDIPLLTELLGFYNSKQADKAFRKKYSETLLSVVKKYPSAEFMGLDFGFMYDSPESETAKVLWRQHFEKKPKDAELRWNASHNMFLVDNEFAIMCLKQGKELEPDDSRWDLQLAGLERIKNMKSKMPEPIKPTPIKEATDVIEKWLMLVDTGLYAESWNTASANFKGAITASFWEQTIKGVRPELGKVLARKVKNANYCTHLPGAPEGKYVVIQYASSFVNKKAAVETVTATMDKDGVWRVSGYFIK